jgi:predicted AAA+ superfamily ATPase
MSYKRSLNPPKSSFFLFGPRGTGKSTWLKDNFKPDLRIDLLRSKELLELSSDPSLLRKRILSLSENSKIVIDEIQKLPQLLDEVHSIIFDFDNKYQFALTGSSARKLKRNHANLLAGRAVKRLFYPLTQKELRGDFNLDHCLAFGSLPAVVNLDDYDDKKDFLYSYVDTYLKEEIQTEAAVRNIPNYNRFLKHAALRNGHVVNINSLSRDAGVARSTLDGYFKILEDTLLGIFIEPLHLKAKVKEVSNPKFYFFDCGVVRCLSNELENPVGIHEKGLLLETYFLNEIRAYSSYFKKKWEIYYWGTPSGGEVDFIIVEGKKKIGIEIKASQSWKKEYDHSLGVLVSEKKIDKAFGVYLGEHKINSGKIQVLPLLDFLNLLNSDKLF